MEKNTLIDTATVSGFSVLYCDDFVVAIHKPAGLLVHRSMMDRHETQFALQMTRDAIGCKVYPVHRLDKATSGLLLFALSAEIAKRLQEQFQDGLIGKHYLALVRGWPREPSWTVDKPLKYQVDRYTEQGCAENKVQSAETAFQRLACCSLDHPVGRFETARYSLLKATPKHGRKHQIRRHLNHCSHPIIGDTNHGDRHHNHFFRDHYQQRRLYLAATEMRFSHPVTAEPMTLNAPLEDTFMSVVSALPWDVSLY